MMVLMQGEHRDKGGKDLTASLALYLGRFGYYFASNSVCILIIISYLIFWVNGDTLDPHSPFV